MDDTIYSVYLDNVDSFSVLPDFIKSFYFPKVSVALKSPDIAVP